MVSDKTLYRWEADIKLAVFFQFNFMEYKSHNIKLFYKYFEKLLEEKLINLFGLDIEIAKK